MSYILDALKRADADRDRQRAAVPDLHAQSDAYPFREPAASSAPRWWLGGAALAALGIAGLAWWLLGASDAPVAAAPPVAVAVPPPAAVAANMPLGVPAAQPAPQPAAVTPAAAVPGPAATAPPVGPPAAVPSPLPPPPPQPRPEPRRPPPVPAPVPAAVPPERVPLYAALPAAVRSQMPALSVNGSVYSRTRGSRIVILNGQVFREGDRPTEGLVVEEIRLKSSVLSIRGTRFELPH